MRVDDVALRHYSVTFVIQEADDLERPAVVNTQHHVPVAGRGHLIEGASEVGEQSPYTSVVPTISDLRDGDCRTLASEHYIHAIHVPLCCTPTGLAIPRVMSSLGCPWTWLNSTMSHVFRLPATRYFGGAGLFCSLRLVTYRRTLISKRPSPHGRVLKISDLPPRRGRMTAVNFTTSEFSNWFVAVRSIHSSVDQRDQLLIIRISASYSPVIPLRITPSNLPVKRPVETLNLFDYLIDLEENSLRAVAEFYLHAFRRQP